MGNKASQTTYTREQNFLFSAFSKDCPFPFEILQEGGEVTAIKVVCTARVTKEWREALVAKYKPYTVTFTGDFAKSNTYAANALILVDQIRSHANVESAHLESLENDILTVVITLLDYSKASELFVLFPSVVFTINHTDNTNFAPVYDRPMVK